MRRGCEYRIQEARGVDDGTTASDPFYGLILLSLFEYDADKIRILRKQNADIRSKQSFEILAPPKLQGNQLL
jgi:hypothetical protein